MTNPYGWSTPAQGQPPVYFAAPGENVPLADPGSYHAAPDAPYDNGYTQYRSYRDQHPHQQPAADPFGHLPPNSSPFLSLSARGARPKVTMTEALILWLRNWRSFSGRASRSEYWWIRSVQLVAEVLWWVLFIGALQMHDLSPTDALASLFLIILLLGSFLITVVTWIPTLSLTVRRLHDTNHSGWYCLLQLVPFGSWALFRAVNQDSDPAGFRFDDLTNRPYGVEDID